jgi:hypothetical protein
MVRRAPFYLYIYLFTDYFSPTEKIMLQIMILAVALVTIIGPAAGKVYSKDDLYALLNWCVMEDGTNTGGSIDDCKCTTFSPIDLN